MPDLDVFGLENGRVTHHRLGNEEYKVLNEEGRNADHHHQNRQQGGRQPHARIRIMRFVRIVVAHRTKEGVPDKAEAIGRREQRTHGRHHRHQPMAAEEDGVTRLFEHHFLGQEAVEQRNTRHRQGRNRRDREGHRHQMAQTAKATDVAGVRLVIDDACGHKQGGLERRVVQDVEYGGQGAKRCTRAQQHRDQAQMADRRKGQERFEVMFEQRDHRAQNHGDQTRRGDQIEPFGRAGKHRPHPRHQEDTGLYHRGRVQIGRHRRRRGHGMGQPEMERKLCGFGETA